MWNCDVPHRAKVISSLGTEEGANAVMKVIVVGGGGREHALIKKLKNSPKIDKLYALPGNGGIEGDVECVAISATDIDAIIDFAARNKIDFAVIAPDDPLVMGAVDRLNAIGIRCFGPVAKAAAIEGSKVFSKGLMRKYGIPTAEYFMFDDFTKACEYIKGARYPVVIKADGLALGKGVTIASNVDEARSALNSIMMERIFGKSGERVIIEEFLTGNEVSVLAFTDGKTIVPLVSALDHKRAHDGNLGPNTGGMGVIAPNPYYTAEIADECMEKIFKPTLNAMNTEGRTFKGCLYFGLILTSDGPKVIEYNCRFGDPEAQAVLPLLNSDLFEIMLAIDEARLDEIDISLSDKSSCCVVIASDGYPGKYSTGHEILLPDFPRNINIYHAGTKRNGRKIFSSGGRVLGVCAVADDMSSAIADAYSAVDKIKFDNAYCRRDIGTAYSKR